MSVLKGAIRPADAGVRPIREFADLDGITAAGEKLEAIRRAAVRFRDRFKAAGTAVAARTRGANRFPWPKDYAFFRAPVPDPITHVVLHNRIEIIRFRQNGERR